MRILLTRPEADAMRSAGRLRSLGHECLISPLLDVVPTGAILPDGGFTALLATSSHAFDDLRGDLDTAKPLPLFCVGERTAEAARAKGFTHVEMTAPDAAALAGAIARHVGRPESFLYLAGRERRPDIERDLAAQGHSVTPCVAYEARAKEHAPEPMIAALRAGEIDAVLHFSPRSAALYVALAEEAQARAEALAPVQVAISARTAEILQGARDLRIAPTPDLDGLIARL